MFTKKLNKDVKDDIRLLILELVDRKFSKKEIAIRAKKLVTDPGIFPVAVDSFVY